MIEWNKVRTYAVPSNLRDFKVRILPYSTIEQAVITDTRRQLTPFVSREIRAEPGDYKGLHKGPQDPYFYVEQWKRYNGVD